MVDEELDGFCVPSLESVLALLELFANNCFQYLKKEETVFKILLAHNSCKSRCIGKYSNQFFLNYVSGEFVPFELRVDHIS